MGLLLFILKLFGYKLPPPKDSEIADEKKNNALFKSFLKDLLSEIAKTLSNFSQKLQILLKSLKISFYFLKSLRIADPPPHPLPPTDFGLNP